MSIPRSKSRNTYIENDNKKEINVCYVMKLEPDVHRHESQGCVFRRPDLISWVFYFKMTLFVSFGFGYWNIEVDFSAVLGLHVGRVTRLVGGL